MSPTSKTSDNTMHGMAIEKRGSRLRSSVFDFRIDSILYALLLQFFFEPMCLQYMESSGRFGSLPGLIRDFYLVVEVIISLFAILIWTKRLFSAEQALLYLCFVWIIIANIINGSESSQTISACGRLVVVAGLICLLLELLETKPEITLKSLLLLFIIHFILSGATVLLMPQAIIDGTTASRIYFFGGKNSIFMWGILLPATYLALFTFTLDEKYHRRSILSALGYIVLALLVQSVSSTICFAALILFAILERRSLLSRRLFSAKHTAVILIACFILIVLMRQVDFISDLLTFLSRDTTFSHRDILWDQGISYVRKAPIFGNGTNIPFWLRAGVDARHPHSFYLSYAVWYGIPCIIFFVLDFIFLANRIDECSSLYIRLISIPMWILLFHSLFDGMEIFNYIYMRTLIEWALKSYQIRKQNNNPDIDIINTNHRIYHKRRHNEISI